jgi:glycosyltransferase involved in cell wall biosynthesis
VPYVTFPLANRRGTTILDRSTAYPLFGFRAGRLAARLAASGQIDLVHGLGASVLGYALAEFAPGQRAPLVMNPQGLEEFGATDPSRAPMKRLAYWPLRMAVRRSARAAECVIATDRSLVNAVTTHLHVRSEAVRVIPNAIELAECDRPDAAPRAKGLRERIGLQPGDLLLVSVGRLEANKGFDVLVRALASLARQQALPGTLAVGARRRRTDAGRARRPDWISRPPRPYGSLRPCRWRRTAWLVRSGHALRASHAL